MKEEIDLSIIGSELRNSRLSLEKITNAVVEKLGLKSKFELNDKYEGSSFLDKHLRRVSSCSLVQRSLNIELCDEKKILKCQSEFTYQNSSYCIIYNNQNEKVLIPNKEFDYFIYVDIRPNYDRATIEKVIPYDWVVQNTNLNQSSVNVEIIDKYILENYDRKI